MPIEITEHLRALTHWLKAKGHLPKQPPRLSGEERKQLQAVNKAVKQLSRSGVAVPEDLRRLKLKLSAKDDSGHTNRAMKIRIEEVDALIKQLGKILKTARLVRDRLKSTGMPGGPKKHYGIKLTDLLREGLISSTDRLELQWSKKGPKHEGKARSDGTIMAKGKGGWKQYASLSAAASKIEGHPLNGWKYWCRVDDDGTSTTLEEIRENYMIGGAR
jgi:Restriction Enzyme Adenine Methylase Associated